MLLVAGSVIALRTRIAVCPSQRPSKKAGFRSLLKDFTVQGASVAWKYYKKTELLHSLASKQNQEACSGDRVVGGVRTGIAQHCIQKPKRMVHV